MKKVLQIQILTVLLLFGSGTPFFAQKTSAKPKKELPEWRKYLLRTYAQVFVDSYGAKVKLDSLIKNANASGDAEKIAHTNEIHGLVFLFQNNERDGSVLFRKSEAYFESKKDHLSLGEYEMRKAFIVFNKLKFKEAEKLFLKSVDWMKMQEDENNVATLYYKLGQLCEYDNRPGEASKYYTDGLKIAERTGNKSLLFQGNLEIGSTMMQMNNAEKAGHYLNKAKEYALEANDTVSIANAYYYLSSFYQNNGNNEMAMLSARKALDHVKYKVNSPIYGTLSSMIAGIMVANGKPDSAIIFASRALERCIEDQNKTGILGSRETLARAYLLKREPAKAIEIFATSRGIMKDLGYSVVVARVYKVLSEAEFALGRSAVAYNDLNEYLLIHDSIFKEDAHKQMANVEASFQNEKKQMEIDVLNKDKEMQEHKISQQNKQKIAMSIGLLIALGFIIFIYKGYKQKKKDAEIIQVQSEKMAEQKKIVEAKNKEVMDSITYAKRLQDAILPSPFEIASSFKEAFILYEPKEIVAGDFYWIEKVNGRVFLAVCDCTGHGVPGAMLSVVGHNSLQRCVNEFGLTDPGKILDKLSTIIEETFSHSIKNVRDGMDISLISFKVNGTDEQKKKGIVSSSLSYGTRNSSEESIEITWAGANNPLWYISSKGEFKEVKADKQPVGKYETRKPFTTHSFTLKDSDCLYVFSDGYADQFGGPKGKKFKYAKLKELIQKNHAQDMQTQLGILDTTFRDWKGDLEQLDDVCMIGIRV